MVLVYFLIYLPDNQACIPSHDQSISYITWRFNSFAYVIYIFINLGISFLVIYFVLCIPYRMVHASALFLVPDSQYKHRHSHTYLHSPM